MINGVTSYRILLFLLSLILTPSLLPAQDMTVSVEPPGGEALQRWPGVFQRNGRVMVTWGDLRYINFRNEVQYTLGQWSKRTSPGAEVGMTIRPDTATPDAGVPSSPYPPARSDQGQAISFDGAAIFGSVQYHAFITKPPAGTDTVYKSHFTVYMPTASGWKGVRVYEGRKSGGAITISVRAYGYNPNTGEVLCVWKTSAEPTVSVSSIDTAGTLRWTIKEIPLGTGRANIVPLSERKFLLVWDTVAISYDTKVPTDTVVFSNEPGVRYQRLRGDQFLRGYLAPDTSHYIFDVYGLDVQKTLSRDVFNNEAQPSYFVAESGGEQGLALVAAGPRGVYAQTLNGDLTPTGPVVQVSKGTDTAYSPAALYTGDSIYIVWQDDRDGEADIYGRIYGYYSIGAVPGQGLARPSDVALAAIAPNPANRVAALDVVLVRDGEIDIEIVDARGAVARREIGRKAQAGGNRIEMSLDDLPSGTYTVVVRAGESTATERLVIVR